jgi:hypothetical protein
LITRFMGCLLRRRRGCGSCSLVILINQSVLMLDLQGERRVRKKNLGNVVEF